ncbi:hypothetical protein JVU11DRAFT_9276 [Chiua virens]|nr:hypothetical protein JVU11DRAFT_9276 [Chiua virens]
MVTESVRFGVPVTVVTPPTPLQPQVATPATIADTSTHTVPVPDNSAPLDSSNSEVGPSTPTSGCRSATVNAVLSATYKQLEDILTNAVEQTPLSVQQILDGWNKSCGRVVNGIDYWNRYGSYLAKHIEQERRRLGLTEDVLVTPTTRRELYAKFKEENPETWQEILDLHDLMETAESTHQTVAQRMQNFSKLRKRLVTILEGAAGKHGFETAIVMCGKVVNEDHSLGFVHTTAGAKKFFETRCRADDDKIIGHLKAHVYNTVSLETVDESFADVEVHERPTDNTLAPRATPATDTSNTHATLGPSADVSDSSKNFTFLRSIKNEFKRLEATPPSSNLEHFLGPRFAAFLQTRDWS